MSQERPTTPAEEQATGAVGGNGAAPAATATASHGDFFGHPRGLSTLFFTELWERFSYYGMRALLVLFMTAAATGDNPGLGLDVGRATAIYGLYTFFVYVLSLPGGWVADNMWGQRRSVFVGGCIIALGHFTMAGPVVGLPDLPTFYLGLMFIVIGTGLLKPNVSSMVGDLYPEGGARRDAGFSIFYMGINIGAILGPLLCGILGEGYNWHWGFSLAGFGMVLGLISYQFGYRYLSGVGELTLTDPDKIARNSRGFYIGAAIFAALVIVIGTLMSTGALGLSLQGLASGLGVVAVVITLAFFAYITFFGGHTVQEKKRLGVIFWLFILAALFWSGFEQAGSSLNLFAADLTDRGLGPYNWIQAVGPIVLTLLVAGALAFVCFRLFRRENLWTVAKVVVAFSCVGIAALAYWLFANLAEGWTAPASTLQLINPLFIVLLAPVFGGLWVWLSKRDRNPSIPVKFALGLFGLAGGFFVLSWGAANATEANPVSPAWLVVTYFLHTCGELCLSPVGLSSMTKLAPPSRVSQMMGIWFVAAALGNLFAGLAAGFGLEALAPSSLFWTVACIIGGGGIVALLAAPPVKRLMGNVE